jgi:hypothetical protein
VADVRDFNVPGGTHERTLASGHRRDKPISRYLDGLSQGIGDIHGE